MGYRGKLRERDAARELRRRGWTMADIARELEVSTSSVSLWTRDVEFTPRPRRNRNFGSRSRGPNALQRRKQAEIDAMNAAGIAEVSKLSERDLLIAGIALYAGEGFKTDGSVGFANTDAQQIKLFMTWLRRFFEIDETRVRLRLYLHRGLDLDAAERFWSDLTGIPRSQFGKPYRAVADAARRNAKHPMGCPAVTYGCTKTHRRIMGLVRALLDSRAIPG